MSTLNLVLLLTVGALGFWVYRLKSKIARLEQEKVQSLVGVGSGISKLNEERVQAKNERKEKILEFLRRSGKVSNDEVEKLLGVSDATATNYLEELEKEGKIRQIGKTGHAVYYEFNG